MRYLAFRTLAYDGEYLHGRFDQHRLHRGDLGFLCDIERGKRKVGQLLLPRWRRITGRPRAAQTLQIQWFRRMEAPKPYKYNELGAGMPIFFTNIMVLLRAAYHGLI